MEVSSESIIQPASEIAQPAPESETAQPAPESETAQPAPASETAQPAPAKPASETAQPAPAKPAPAKPASETAQMPIQRSMDSLDTLYNKIILNSSLLSTIHDLKTTGFTNTSIPLLVLSIIATYNSYTTATRAYALTVDDIQVLLERVYNYLVDKYNLIDVPHRLSMYNLFELSLKLCLTTPNIKKDVSSCLKFFKCSKQ